MDYSSWTLTELFRMRDALNIITSLGVEWSVDKYDEVLSEIERREDNYVLENIQ